MDDPARGRPMSDGNNDTCAELKGLFSCAVYSPTAGTFVRGLRLLDSGDSGDTVVFQLSVCKSFCRQVVDHCCSNDYCKLDDKIVFNDFCRSALGDDNMQIVVDDDDDACYSAGTRTAGGPSAALVLLAACLAGALSLAVLA